MLNKLLALFGYQLNKLEPKSFLKDINFDENDEVDKKVEYFEPNTKDTVIPVEKNTCPKKKISELTIYLNSKEKLVWTAEIDEKNNFPWNDFYTWYFSRDTPIFVFKSKTGESVFKRADIVRFELLKFY